MQVITQQTNKTLAVLRLKKNIESLVTSDAKQINMARINSSSGGNCKDFLKDFIY